MSTVKDAIRTVKDLAAGLTQKFLGQERVSQFRADDPNSKYACFFTSCYMYFRTVYKIKLTFNEYKRECLRVKAIRNDYYLLNRDAMAAAAGYPNLRCFHTSSGIEKKIYELLLKNKPVPFSLSGRHFESIDGFETQGNELLFTVDDPGGQGDEWASASELCVFKIVDGKRVYSRHPDGSKRKITTVYWFE